MKKTFYIKSKGVILNDEALEGLPLLAEIKVRYHSHHCYLLFCWKFKPT